MILQTGITFLVIQHSHLSISHVALATEWHNTVYIAGTAQSDVLALPTVDGWSQCHEAAMSQSSANHAETPATELPLAAIICIVISCYVFVVLVGEYSQSPLDQCIHPFI